MSTKRRAVINLVSSANSTRGDPSLPSPPPGVVPADYLDTVYGPGDACALLTRTWDTGRATSDERARPRTDHNTFCLPQTSGIVNEFPLQASGNPTAESPPTVTPRSPPPPPPRPRQPPSSAKQ
ncbi:unnamed protein product [Danaus chrysippus]|uniref:(African queen) hypothetical protein n=1 Tax=Danaus chrysippus TaxID=151541 RepID=A0A8J2QVG7_9NEOP|nr:unnamed protein product [Danaus chrysippus]